MKNTIETFGLSACLALVAATCVYGHGSMQHPPSRVYIGWADGVKNSPHAAIQAAIEVGGTQPFYDWNEVVNFFPGAADAQLNASYESVIPDGQLASGGNPKYAGLDLVRDDWPATPVEAGPYEFVLYASTPHNPLKMNAWITTPEWDPSQPLTWGKMDPLELGPVSLTGNEYRFTSNLPPRAGKHAILVVWQRIDPAGEGFYSLSDVDFGDCVESCECPGDINLDGAVDGADMGELLAAWNTPAGDVNGNGTTDGSDLGIMLTNWGTCGFDCNGNGVSDYEEIEEGDAPDCNHDGIPDDCQEKSDCDGDGIWDECAIGEGVVADCNTNLIPDSCELASGDSDEDGDGILDDCQFDGLTYRFIVDNEWNGGFTATLEIFNDTKQCLSGWELLFESEFEVENAWNGRLVPRNDGRVRIVNETWNGDVCHGSSFTVGFQGLGSPSIPTNIYVNDSAVEAAP